MNSPATPAGDEEMQTAKNLTDAIELVVKVRRQVTTAQAIWDKVNRVADYLNAQLATELTNW